MHSFLDVSNGCGVEFSGSKGASFPEHPLKVAEPKQIGLILN
jgi:hypothetical protein